MFRFLTAVVLLNSSSNVFQVLLAWEAMRLSVGAGGPATIFVASSLTNILVAPLSGSIVDRIGPKRGLVAAETMRALSVAGFAALRWVGVGSSMTGLIITSVTLAMVSSLSNPSFHSIAQRYATTETATVIASRTAFCIATGFFLGYLAGGLILQYVGLFGCSFAGILLAVCTVIIVGTLRPPHARPTSHVSVGSGISAIRLLWQIQPVREAAYGYIMCYAVFSSVTALLAPFVKYVLQLSAADFGLVRGTWSFGSAAAAMAMALLWGKRPVTQSFRHRTILSLGLGLMAFSYSTSLTCTLVMIAVVGFLHGLSRSVLDGMLIEYCESHVIGRARSGINSLIAFISLSIYLSTMGIHSAAVVDTFRLVGGCVAVACLWPMARRLLSRRIHHAR